MVEVDRKLAQHGSFEQIPGIAWQANQVASSCK
jgi:hypothetical protein